MALQLGPDGRTWKTTNLPEFLSLCDKAEAVFTLLRESMSQKVIRFEFDWGMDVVVAALGVNYRVSAAELSLLGCVSDVMIAEIMKAVCDWDAYVDAVIELSKNESASASADTGSGAEATSEATSPPSAT